MTTTETHPFAPFPFEGRRICAECGEDREGHLAAMATEIRLAEQAERLNVEAARSATCDRCQRLATLTACEGERLCPRCADAYVFEGFRDAQARLYGERHRYTAPAHLPVSVNAYRLGGAR